MRIPLDSVHPRWRKLDMLHEPQVIVSNPPVQSTLDRLAIWMEGQNEDTKRMMSLKIEELMNPEITVLKEPRAKVKTKGRPSKAENSTRRLPSAFEYALSGQGSHSPSPTICTVGTNSPKKMPKARVSKLKVYNSFG